MAEDTLTGKTGDDLEKSLIQKQAKKAEQTTLKPGEKIPPTTMKVEDKELIGDVTTQERTTTAAPDIDPEKYTQEIPKGTAATFDADKAAPTSPIFFVSVILPKSTGGIGFCTSKPSVLAVIVLGVYFSGSTLNPSGSKNSSSPATISTPSKTLSSYAFFSASSINLGACAAGS